VNDYDFKRGERPDTMRPEEEFMYKYLKKIEKREKRPEPGSDDEENFDENGDKISNLSEEEFANKEIMKEMDRLQSGAGNVSDDEDVDVSYSSNSDAEEVGSDDGFFSDQDDLEEVEESGGEEAEEESADMDEAP